MNPASHSRTSLSSLSRPSSALASLERIHSRISNVATTGRSYARSRSSSRSLGHMISVSELASSEAFDEWRRGTPLLKPLSVGGGARWDAFPVPQTVRNLGNYLLDVRLPDWVFETSSHIAPLPGVRHVDMYVEEDAALKSAYERLDEESAELTRLHNQQMTGELNWRMPVDFMIRKAFVKPRALPNIPNPAESDFICDLALDMPHSTTPLNISIDPTVIADAVISTSLYPSPSMFSLDSQIFEELRVDKESHDSPVVCVPHLIVKHKNKSGNGSGHGSVSSVNMLNDATNELEFCIGACMQQRRLLGLERETMFGIACSAGRARAFTAYWRDNQIQIVRLYAEDFDLQVLEQSCLFFALLLRIRHYINMVASELEHINGSEIEEKIKISERSWKADPTDPAPPGTSWPIPSPPRFRSRSRSRSPSDPDSPFNPGSLSPHALRRRLSKTWSISTNGSTGAGHLSDPDSMDLDEDCPRSAGSSVAEDLNARTMRT